MTRPEQPAGTTYGYCRVSTDRQVAEGESLESQRMAIARYCEYRGWPFDPGRHLFVDHGVSAFKKDLARREAGGALVGRLRRGDRVVVTALDRAFRRVADCAVQVDRWDRMGVTLVLLSAAGQTIDASTAAGRLLLNMMAVVAEWESNVRAERARLQHALARARKQPVSFGTCPYGFQWETVKGRKVLVEHPEERALMRQMLAWWEDGWSVEAIRRHLAYTLKVKVVRRPGAGRKARVIQWTDKAVRVRIRAEAALREQEQKKGTEKGENP